MNKYGGASGTSTALLDLYDAEKIEQGWTEYMPFRTVSFIPTADCNVTINGSSDQIPVKADIGFSDEGTHITSFVVVESGIEYVLAYRY